VQSGHPEQFFNFWAICFWAVVTGVIINLKKKIIIIKKKSRSLANGRLSGGNPNRLKYYYLLAYLLSIIIPVGFATFCLLFENLDFLLNIWITVAKQRSVPGFHFAHRTEDREGCFEANCSLAELKTF
jgi:hypothetical protein